MPSTYYQSLQSAMKAYPNRLLKPRLSFWKTFCDPNIEEPPFISKVMNALPRRDYMFRDIKGAHIFTFEYYLGIFNYMLLWMVTMVIVSAGIFLITLLVEKSRKELSQRKAKIILKHMYTLAITNIIIAIIVTLLVETSFVLMFKFLYIYHTCAPQKEYLRIVDGVRVIRKARFAATTDEFRKKYRKLLNKNHADIEFMKLDAHLESQLYNLRYIIKTSVFEGTCAVAYWRTLFYTVTANVVWAIVPFSCIQMLIITREKPTRSGFNRIKKFAIMNFISCWSLVSSLMWLVMIASDYCYNPAIITANQTYANDHLTPFYLGVLPFQHIRNAINFFKEFNNFVNHTKFANAFYAPNFGSVVILEMVIKFYHDLLQDAAKDKEIDAMLHDIGDRKAIKDAINITVEEGLIGLYKGKFIRPIHDRLMIIGCRFWVPVVLAILFLICIMYGTFAFMIIYATKGVKHLTVFVKVGSLFKHPSKLALFKKKTMIQVNEWGRRLKILHEKELDREKDQIDQKETKTSERSVASVRSMQRRRRRRTACELRRYEPRCCTNFKYARAPSTCTQ